MFPSRSPSPSTKWAAELLACQRLRRPGFSDNLAVRSKALDFDLLAAELVLDRLDVV